MTEEETAKATDWLRELLATVTYRPGWTFDADHVQFLRDDPGHIELCIQVTVPDRVAAAGGTWWARRTDGLTTLSYRQDVTTACQHRLTGAIGKLLWDGIRDTEDHERLEWLQRAGAPWFDPHPADWSGPSLRRAP